MGASWPIALPVKVMVIGNCAAMTGESMGAMVRFGAMGPGSCTVTLAEAEMSSVSHARSAGTKNLSVADAVTNTVMELLGGIPASGAPVHARRSCWQLW